MPPYQVRVRKQPVVVVPPGLVDEGEFDLILGAIRRQMRRGLTEGQVEVEGSEIAGDFKVDWYIGVLKRRKKKRK